MSIVWNKLSSENTPVKKSDFKKESYKIWTALTTSDMLENREIKNIKNEKKTLIDYEFCVFWHKLSCKVMVDFRALRFKLGPSTCVKI